MGTLRLRHLHLPSLHPHHHVPYRLATRVQEHLRRAALDYKDRVSHASHPGSSSSPLASSPAPQLSSQPLPPPPPTLISFTPAPIYTLGRRQTAPLSPAETARLRAPLQLPSPSPISASPSHLRPSHAPPNAPAATATATATAGTAPAASHRGEQGEQGQEHPILVRPLVQHAPRGGLTTYHGPGQAVLWPVLDLHDRRFTRRERLTVRCYARLLEETSMGVLGGVFALRGARTTADPGVWVPSHTTTTTTTHGGTEKEGGGDGTEEEGLAKIAALGVHLRRHVTALGTALNVAFPPWHDTREAVNPWARFVACGLEGKRVTSLAVEVPGGLAEVDVRLYEYYTSAVSVGTGDGEMSSWLASREARVAGAWAAELARRLGVEGGVEVVEGREVVELMERVVREAGERRDGGGGGEDGVEAVGEDEVVYVERVRELVEGR